MRDFNLITRGLTTITVATITAFSSATAQTTVTSVTPTSISFDSSSTVCNNSGEVKQACLKLGGSAFANKVDVFFLFDDTGSFAGSVPKVTQFFADVVNDLETTFPGVEFGYGVGRFEDYGGPGRSYSSEDIKGRPFVLNQPIVTSATAGGTSSLLTLINSALNRTAPGFGGDGPETSIAEGLFQVATGAGFDGDGDGSSTGTGGAQVAGLLTSQVSPDDTGDVPAFASLDSSVPHSGTIGGAGFRADALKLVILATDICSVAAFTAGTAIPSTLIAAGSTEFTSELTCSNFPGSQRFGFVGDSVSKNTNTVFNAVAPLGAATVPQTIAALNSLGIRVLGMAPFGGAPTPKGSGPTSSPSVFLSALARMTGGVDQNRTPLVFDLSGDKDELRANITAAIIAAAKAPIDLAVGVSGSVPSALDVTPNPETKTQVALGSEACFDIAFNGKGDVSGAFNLDFVAKLPAPDRTLPEVSPTPSEGGEFLDSLTASTPSIGGTTLATIPVTATCAKPVECGDVNLFSTVIALDGGAARQKDLVVRAANRLRRAGGRSSDVKSIIASANRIYETMWLGSWSLKQNISTCPASEACVTINNVNFVSSYQSAALELHRLVDSAVRKTVAKRKSKKLTRDDSKLLSQSRTRRDSNSKNASTVPTTASVCVAD